MGKKLFWGLAAVTGVSIASAFALGACSQTPTSVPQRTFDRAQKVDVVCMQVLEQDPNDATSLLTLRPPRPLPQENCTPVPTNVDGSLFLNQLYAVVTQTSRGEVAVVNLSAGVIEDTQKAIPSINFIPVGAIPTDVATTPDGQMVFVASAEVNKPAIYGIPSTRLLGDNPAFATEAAGTVASWPVCLLPQNPGALSIVPRPNPTGVKGPADYEIVAVLPGSRLDTAKVVTIDPKPFLRGANAGEAIADAGLGDLDAGTTGDAGDVIAPGSLAPCPITSAIELVGASSVPPSFVPGPNWPNGVPYVDGGIDLTCQRPLPAASCGQKVPCCDTSAPTVEVSYDGGVVDAAGGDAGDGGDAGTCEPLGTTPPSDVALNVGTLDPPRLVAAARNGQVLYVSDDTVPFIHVVDLSSPGALQEISPLLATSLLNPTRQVSVADITVSPTTHDFKQYLYAVDKIDGSIIVYDITDPLSTQRTPLTRPNPELNPFQPPDRIAFSSPVVAVAFARHDRALSTAGNVNLPNAKSGLLCNPSTNLNEANAALDFGFFYRADQNQNESLTQFALGPTRLRGIFAFATLANGQVIAVDVDDWDAPCRRPTTIGDSKQPPWSLAIPEPAPAGTTDIDPYHVPTAIPADAVSEEAFFPVSAPHRLRSSVLLNDDSATGNHLPRFQSAPTVSTKDIPLPTTGPDALKTPRLNLLFSFDVPDVHIDQAWALTYEGSIPGFDGLSATLTTADSYESLDFSQSQGQFCAKGVEDWTQGAARADAINASLKNPDPELFRRTADYISLTEDLLDSSDPYWGLNDPADSCWDPQYQTAQQRFDICNQTFGAASDENEQRDYPILEAFDGKLVVGRFFRPAAAPGAVVAPPRQIVGRDPSNAAALKLVRCCFHRQARFHVRTGGLWSAVASGISGGSGLGFLNHMTTGEGGRCVPSCDTRESLLNGRLPAIPFDGNPVDVTTTDQNVSFLPRDSAAGMRNPMFSANIINPASGTLPVRDTVFKFTTAGQFSPLFINIGSTTTSINPQSIRFIESLGQLAVVDAASQGLVLIDLDNVTIAHDPYF